MICKIAVDKIIESRLNYGLVKILRKFIKLLWFKIGTEWNIEKLVIKTRKK